MIRRATISALWFAAFFCLHELAWSLFGSPRLLGVAIGGLAAAFVWLDPLYLSHTEPTLRATPRALAPDLEAG